MNNERDWKCHSCEEDIEVAEDYVLEGNDDVHHKNCFDDWATEEYRYSFNDYGYHKRK